MEDIEKTEIITTINLNFALSDFDNLLHDLILEIREEIKIEA